MKNIFILVTISLVLAVTSLKYDNNSCKTLLPVIKNANLWVTLEGKSSPSGNIGSNQESSEETSEGEDDDEDENVENAIDLVPALERSPYKIETSCLKYRRNRVMTITIEGSKLNGLLLQARQRFPSSLSTRPIYIGNFIDLEEDFATLDCNTDENPYKSSSVFNTHQRMKTDIKLKWKAPTDDFDSIEFMATIIRGKYYWTHIKSMPIFFNQFPPSFVECGKHRACRQYVKDPNLCEDGYCRDYALVSYVLENFVTFYVGGKIDSDTGFIGVGFTKDKKKLSFLDMSICRKTDQHTADVVNYKVNKSLGHIVKQADILDSIAYDIEDDYLWCTFRRPLRGPGSPLNFSKELFQVLIWGKLDSETSDPLLPNEKSLLKEMWKWNSTETYNKIQYYSGSNVIRLNWVVWLLVLFANLIN